MRGSRIIAGAAAMLAASIAAGAEPVPAIDAAHALAQKFAQDGQPKAKPAETIPARPTLDYEMEMLKRARAEAAERAKKSAPMEVPAASTTATAPQAKATEAPPPAAAAMPPPAAASVAVAVKPPPENTPVEPKPAIKTEAPSAPAAIMAPPQPAPVTPPSDTPKVEAKDAPASAETYRIVDSGLPAVHASVLLVFDTGTHSGDRPNAAHDPIICAGNDCYISAGLSSDAHMIPRAEAEKLKISPDSGAESCKGMSACAFRNVSLKAGTNVEVIEMGSHPSVNHDAGDAKVDASCKIDDGDLECDDPLTAPDVRLWIVPEEVARKAGTSSLEDALAEGLPQEDSTRVTDK